MYTIRSSKENTNLMKEFDRMSSMKDIVLNNFIILTWLMFFFLHCKLLLVTNIAEILHIGLKQQSTSQSTRLYSTLKRGLFL
jgi:hypothetical protein